MYLVRRGSDVTTVVSFLGVGLIWQVCFHLHILLFLLGSKAWWYFHVLKLWNKIYFEKQSFILLTRGSVAPQFINRLLFFHLGTFEDIGSRPDSHCFNCFWTWCHHLVSHLVQNTLIFMQQNRPGRIRHVLLTLLSALIDFRLSLSGSLVLLLGSRWSQFSVPGTPLGHSSTRHFTLKHFGDGLRCTWPQRWSSETPSWGAAFVCVVRTAQQRPSCVSPCVPVLSHLLSHFLSEGTDRAGRRRSGFPRICPSFRFTQHWLKDDLIFFPGLVKESCQQPSSQPTLLRVKPCCF